MRLFRPRIVYSLDSKRMTPRKKLLGGLVVAALIASLGLLIYITSDKYDQQDPNIGLNQPAIFYLNEPAPFARQLGLQAGSDPAIIIICRGCRPPMLDGPVTVRVTGDRQVAEAYKLIDEEGQIAKGYALIDRAGNVRYRTFDATLENHASEINKLIKNLP